MCSPNWRDPVSAPRWFLDELAHAGPEHLDQTYASTYDRKAQTSWTPEIELLRGLGLDSSATLVDLGAGTGSFALAAAPFCARVVAVDISPAMLGLLQAEAARLGLTNLECIQAGFLTYQHQGPPADVVYSRNALHHLPDFWKAIAVRRIAEMLRPDGVFRLRDLVYSFDPGEAETVIDAWVAGGAARPEDGWTGPEYETHVREEHSTFTWLIEPLLARAGFRIDAAEYTGNRTFAAYVCRKV